MEECVECILIILLIVYVTEGQWVGQWNCNKNYFSVIYNAYIVERRGRCRGMAIEKWRRGYSTNDVRGVGFA